MTRLTSPRVVLEGVSRRFGDHAAKLIPNDPIVVRKDLPASLRSAIQESLTTMRARNPEAFKEAGATVGGFVPADDSKYQVIRDLNETAKRLAAQK